MMVFRLLIMYGYRQHYF